MTPAKSEAAASLETRLGPAHPQLGVTLDRLTGVLIERHAYRDALRISDRAVRILRTANGDNHLSTLSASDRLATIQAALHQHGEAQRIGREVIGTISKSLESEAGRPQKGLRELLRSVRLHLARSELSSGRPQLAESILVAVRGDPAGSWRKGELRLLDSLTAVLARR